jgi:DnaJ-class molecular chaperone
MTCIICQGKGTIEKEQSEICDNCFGSGEVGTEKGG